jgi:hypothetical protein
MPEAGSVQGVTLSRDQISWSLEGATALPVTKKRRSSPGRSSLALRVPPL